MDRCFITLDGGGNIIRVYRTSDDTGSCDMLNSMTEVTDALAPLVLGETYTVDV